MFTRCPQCKSVHPLTASLIAYARGAVRCGECNKTFDSLAFLFDQWPSGRAYGPARGSNTGPPVIGGNSKSALPASDTVAAKNEVKPAQDKPGRLAWGLLAAAMVMITLANTAWTFREPLIREPEIRSWLQQNGWLPLDPQGLGKEPGQILLVSRDMHTHPTRTGILVLSLTFVNLAQQSQNYPVLEVTLMDATSQPVARRQFQPRHYLRPGADLERGLARDVYLPVLLELGDPGQQAVGFEIQFL